MAIIQLHSFDAEKEYKHETIAFDGFAHEWIVNNLSGGNSFKVYQGGLSGEHEITHSDAMEFATDVCIVTAPGDVVTAVYAIVAVVVGVGVALLTPQPKALDNVNRQQESPNNSLSDRRNTPRPNQRIVDICGEVKSIPDVAAAEWAKYESDIEVRTGYYCIARNNIDVKDIRDGDTLFSDSEQSAGVYGPYKSPNNSAPDIQVGELINETVYGVFQPTDALDQTIPASNEVAIDTRGTNEILYPTGLFEANADFDQTFIVGDMAKLVNVEINGQVIGPNAMPVTAVTSTSIQFDISGDPSWAGILPGGQPIDRGLFPRVEKVGDTKIGPYTISSTKIDRLIVNVYAPAGMYKEEADGRQGTQVDYTVIYQKLNDNLDPVGPETPIDQIISGRNASVKGNTTDVNLGGLTFVRWWVQRNTPKDYEFNGNVVDEIKLRSVFGLFSVNKTDFGNVTTIQTQRKAIDKTTVIKEPEVNVIATEKIYKYLGNDVFDTNLSVNTQAMQSLIRLALDPKVGRRHLSELDADLLIQIQDENESYFNSVLSGQFSYSFDSTKTTAQDTFYTIANAAFITLWREGRVLKGWFEQPQSIPNMVFTHRSKVPNSETWTRDFSSTDRKDSIEFKYTDDEFYTQEILYFPEDRSGKNPLKLEISGIKGITQATWRMMREYQKLRFQEITVDFTSTPEGRFVRPQQVISVVKGSRVFTYDGEILEQNGLLLALSQDIPFEAGEDYTIVLKRRDGSTESIPVFDNPKYRVVQLGFLPGEDIYTGNSALRTEFSIGSESRLKGQLMIPQEIDPSDKNSVKIKAVNYSDLYYEFDPVQVIKSGFSDGFSDGFF